MCSRLGVVGSGAGGAASQGADATDPIPDSPPGADAPARTASASREYGGLYAADRTTCSERDGTHLGPGGPLAQARVDSSGPGQGQEGDPRALERHGGAGLRAQIGRHATWVFTYEGERIKQVSTAACYKARKRAGIEDFRWHDLRHTWASWHVQNGTPLFALQELAGWETEKMVRRYAHLAAEHLAAYAGNTESYGTNTAQPPDFHGAARLKVVGN